MIIYPAMDLFEGRCIRLYQGDYNRAITYSDDPIKTALEFQNSGVQFLHIVDLQGAKEPHQRQIELIKALIKETTLRLQIGGGIRQIDEVETLLSLGVERVMIGSLAVQDTTLVKSWLKTYNKRLLLTLDVRIDEQNRAWVTTNGWQSRSHITLFELIDEYLPYGLKHILCTDIACDGTLSGNNTALYRAILQKYPDINCIASGGTSTIDDLAQLRTIGVSGVVIGKALYEKKIQLKDIL